MNQSPIHLKRRAHTVGISAGILGATILALWSGAPAREDNGSAPAREAITGLSYTAKSSAAANAAPAGPERSLAEPWETSDLIQPEQLAARLADSGKEEPLIVYVGFPLLFASGHIPGALYFGPGREQKGIVALKKWARSLRAERPVVMYCGCCPWMECPNVRPAFRALRAAGLKRLKLLYLEDSFLRDWINKGHPVEKGK